MANADLRLCEQASAAAKKHASVGAAIILHAGLAVIAAAAIYSLQPALSLKQWLPYLLVALAMLISALATRGRFSGTAGGKLLVALGASLALRLAHEPQLASISALSHISWLGITGLGISVVGVLLAAIGGYGYIVKCPADQGAEIVASFRWALHIMLILIVGLGLVSFFGLRQFYEIDRACLGTLIAGVLQYYWLGLSMLSASGEKYVGAAPHIYLGIALILAFIRNALGGGLLPGGEGP